VAAYVSNHAWITGDLLRRFNLPRLTGYLIFGIVVGPQIGNVITVSMAGQLQVVTGIATTLIALIAGLTLNLDRMRRRLAGIVSMTGATLALTMTGLAVLLWIAWPWLPVAPGATGAGRLVMVALLVVILVSFSPTMTAAVITDTGARGRLSETVLAMVHSDLVLLVSFVPDADCPRCVQGHEGAAIDIPVRFRGDRRSGRVRRAGGRALRPHMRYIDGIPSGCVHLLSRRQHPGVRAARRPCSRARDREHGCRTGRHAAWRC
jgi:hypothetical protein